ncbi:MAG TPA: DUF58 domain-containing protein [Spirochaetia bacterium]|nr:DUF58 domain-containing protein [Spirochaetia bacterium]
MTGPWRFVAAIGVMLFLWGILLSNASLVIIALPVLAFALAPFALPLPLAAARASLEIERGAVPAGESVPVIVSVTNVGPAVPLALISFCLPDGVRADGATQVVASLEADGVTSFSCRVSASRGVYELRFVRLTTCDLLALQKHESLLPVNASMRFMPRVERLESVEIFPSRTRVLPGSIPSRSMGSGVEFFGTREYSPGDQRRQVNWRAGERWDQLVTNVFNEEKAADVGIVLDARQASEVIARGGSLFEHSVHAAAAIADYFLHKGNRVGLLNYGSFVDWIFPGYGELQRARILLALCRAKPGDHAAFREFSYLPIRLFPPRAQLVFISPLRTDDVPSLRYLRALKFELLVVSPDPVSFETQGQHLDRYGLLAERILRAQRTTLLTGARRSGARVIEWDTSIPLGVTLHRLGRSRQT